MKPPRPKLIDLIAPALKQGDWVVIGHDSAIKLSGRSILHRCNGRTERKGLGWLVNDKPLLNWILSQEAA